MTALTLDALKTKAASGEIDTVLACGVDMQGRLIGKRFHVANFLEAGIEETHCCNYLLATDLEMATPDGFAATSWAAGYGDFTMAPDLATLAPVPWLQGTALVLCDILDHHSHAPVPHSPRADPQGAGGAGRGAGVCADDGHRARVFPVPALL